MNRPRPARAAEIAICGGCDARWTSRAAAHCSTCHRTFSTAGHFDRHRSAHGNRGTCLDPATLRSVDGGPALFERDGMWRGPEMTDDEKQRVGARTAA